MAGTPTKKRGGAGSYRKGARFEIQVRDYLKDRGYYACRVAGSHDWADVVAVGRGVSLLVQCKTGGRLPADEREGLLQAALGAGAIPVLAYRDNGIQWNRLDMGPDRCVFDPEEPWKR